MAISQRIKNKVTNIPKPTKKQHGIEIRVPYSNIKNFQVSKEGSAKKAMIRLAYADRSDKLTLDFSTRFNDRDAVRDILNNLQRRAGASATAATKPSTFETPRPQQPQQQDTPKMQPLTREEVLRRAKIMAHKNVQKLHKQLVGNNVVTDAQFWSAMRFRYKDSGEPRTRNNPQDSTSSSDDDEQQKSADMSLKLTGQCGVPSDAFGPSAADETSTSTSSTTVSKWISNIPTSSERHLVFMEKPAVARAYRHQVGGNKMTEQQFWMLFVSSSYAGRRVGRMTKSDTTRTAEADAMFSPFEAEEKRLSGTEEAERAKRLAHELDLDRADDHRGAHVNDAHRLQGDVPREMARTKRFKSDGDGGGRIGGGEGLRLMRLVNRHGGLVLDEGGIGGWVAQGVDRERPLDDLEEGEEIVVAKLGVRDGIAGLMGRGQGNNGSANGSGGGTSAMVKVGWEECREMTHLMNEWQPNVGRFRHEIGGSDRTLKELLSCMKP